MRTFLLFAFSCLLVAIAAAQDDGQVQLPPGNYTATGPASGSGFIFDDKDFGTFSPDDTDVEYDMRWCPIFEHYDLYDGADFVGWIFFTPQHEGYWNYTIWTEDGKKTGTWKKNP